MPGRSGGDPSDGESGLLATDQQVDLAADLRVSCCAAVDVEDDLVRGEAQYRT